MPSPRYTVRVPEPLHTLVQEYMVLHRTPFAVLIRDALSAYLADTTPTVTPTPADSADTLSKLQAQLADVTARVKVIEEMLTKWPPFADSPADTSTDRPQTDAGSTADSCADTAPTGADIPAPPRRPGRPSSPLRQQILDLLLPHPEGLRAEEIRVYLQAQRPIGDTLQGMLKAGVIIAQGQGTNRRYVLAE
jgi:hypothetical protein